MPQVKNQPLFRKIDCIRLFAPDLESGLHFYRDQLGHELIWRTEHAAGLRMPETDAEIVLQTDDQRQETDITVESADEAAKRIAAAGGKIIVQAFDIQIGRCVVVEDLFGNPLVLLDISKGLLKTDSMGNVLGNQKP
jgi:predicted enzyme related to lactoylglutathione lyase